MSVAAVRSCSSQNLAVADLRCEIAAIDFLLALAPAVREALPALDAAVDGPPVAHVHVPPELQKALPSVMHTQSKKQMLSARSRRSTRGGGRATPRDSPGQRARAMAAFCRCMDLLWTC